MAERVHARRHALLLAAVLAVVPLHDAAGGGGGEGEEQALLEFHFAPSAADLQIAIWLTDAQGNFIADVFVTQATAKLGIGNRPGQPLFLSSWRAPYGPRAGVLPIWAHQRGRSYPRISFFDASVADQASQGYHENTSSPESYFCRPLTPEEDLAIIDMMSCPSPSTFSTDKGQIVDGETSPYPPRGDLTSVHERDSPDVALFAELNDLDDLDIVSGATPLAGPYMVAHRLDRALVADGPVIAWIEVSRERDENEDWSFEREDHTIDAAIPLAKYGREFLGQPAVVYRVELDPSEVGYVATLDYAGYGDLYGQSGVVYPPDSTISSSGGSGADRLAAHESFGELGRLGVYSHGWGSGAGACPNYTPPPVEQLEIESIAFDRVRARFRLPQLPAGAEPSSLRVAWMTPETSAFEFAAAKQVTVPRLCSMSGTPGSPAEVDCIDPRADAEIEVEIDQLFGNYGYTIGIAYEDRCTNRSEIVTVDVTTPIREFSTIDGACFVATAAWGAPWTEELRALRWVRDAYMIGQPIADDLVRAYEAYGPVLAGMIRDVPPARAAARLLLRPIARVAMRLTTSASTKVRLRRP
jgi:hypothetical protein